MKNKILISINIYSEKYYLRQLNNIKKFCLFDDITIIYNCSKKFNDKLLTAYNCDTIKIIVNTEKIDKRRHTGLITKGIFSNFLHEKKNSYSQVLILSERSIFCNFLSQDICCNKLTNCNNNLKFKYNHITNKTYSTNCDKKACKIWINWKHLINYNLKNKLNKSLNLLETKFICSAHEGLILDGNAFKILNEYIINLTSDKLDIIYNSNWCIEEYIISNLCYNLNCKCNSLLRSGNKIIYNMKTNPMFNHYKCITKIKL